MSIVSHELVYSAPNGTRLDVRYKFIDHLGIEIFADKRVTTTTDLTADRIAMIPGIELTQAEKEVYEAVGRAEQGISPDITPDYQPQADYDRRALGQFMTIADVHHFNEGLPLFNAMESRGGANANQRATYLGITNTTYGLMEDRFNELPGVQFFLSDVKNQRWDDIPEEMR